MRAARVLEGAVAGEWALHFVACYSDLSATSWPTLVTRRAGMEHASSAMLMNMKVAAAKVVGSVGVTPKSRHYERCWCRNRVPCCP